MLISIQGSGSRCNFNSYPRPDPAMDLKKDPHTDPEPAVNFIVSGFAAVIDEVYALMARII